MPAISSLTRPLIIRATTDIRGEQVTVEFDRSKVTFGWIKRMREALVESDVVAMAGEFAAAIHGWDITNEDGTPFPPTVENFERLPEDVLGLIFASMRDAAVPGEAEGKASPATTAAASEDSRATGTVSPNGPPTLPSPTVSASP